IRIGETSDTTGVASWLIRTLLIRTWPAAPPAMPFLVQRRSGSRWRERSRCVRERNENAFEQGGPQDSNPEKAVFVGRTYLWLSSRRAKRTRDRSDRGFRASAQTRKVSNMRVTSKASWAMAILAAVAVTASAADAQPRHVTHQRYAPNAFEGAYNA